MSCTGCTLSRLPALKRAVPLGLAFSALLASRQAGAQQQQSQQQQQPSLPAYFLPSVPPFQLSLPALPLPSNQWLWLRREGSPVAVYWKIAFVPREWRDARDDELRLELQTGRWDLGQLSLTSEISTVPGRERDCGAACRGASWSSALRLKYDAGELGPLHQTGPELNVGFTPARPGTKSQGLLRGGFSGKF